MSPASFQPIAQLWSPHTEVNLPPDSSNSQPSVIPNHWRPCVLMYMTWNDQQSRTEHTFNLIMRVDGHKGHLHSATFLLPRDGLHGQEPCQDLTERELLFCIQHERATNVQEAISGHCWLEIHAELRITSWCMCLKGVAFMLHEAMVHVLADISRTESPSPSTCPLYANLLF